MAFNWLFNVEIHIIIELTMKAIGFSIAIYGVYLYHNSSSHSKSRVLVVCFFANLILHSPNLLVIQNKMGAETQAYLEHA